jgi:hypothetical protein
MKRRKKKTRDPVALFESTCGWCGKHIPANTEVFGGGGKARPGLDLSEQAGQIMAVHMTTLNRTVLVAVAGLDSEARREGYDFVYMTCSAECGEQLRAAFQVEIERGNQQRLG